MKIKDIISVMESMAPLPLQEDYDNAGLATGCPDEEASGCLVCLDINERVIDEAIEKGCNLVISHHPVIFKGIKRLTGQSMTERIITMAIRKNIAIYSIHTNLDNIAGGVNRMLCEKLGLTNLSILRKTAGILNKLVTFCPPDHAGNVRQALFDAGAGHIGEYDQCSFNAEGLGSFRAGDKADPFVGKIGEIHFEKEVRIETIFPAYLKNSVINAILQSHPYEEVAYDVYRLENEFDRVGAGMTGELFPELSEEAFLQKVKDPLGVQVIRHSALLGKKIGRVAVCGGSGSFLIPDAIKHKAEAFISADIKYHQFFDADGKIVIIDGGHFETEQFTCALIADHLKKKFSTFAVQISETPVNPVNYF